MAQHQRPPRPGSSYSGAALRICPDFIAFYVETAERDHFRPPRCPISRPPFDALLGEDPDRIRLYMAHHEGDLIAATTWVRAGQHTWYSYGASSTAKRDVRRIQLPTMEDDH